MSQKWQKERENIKDVMALPPNDISLTLDISPDPIDIFDHNDKEKFSDKKFTAADHAVYTLDSTSIKYFSTDAFSPALIIFPDPAEYPDPIVKVKPTAENGTDSSIPDDTISTLSPFDVSVPSDDPS
eukprot:CAMPEP_0194315740 /NCGR_PEP_ID=MMETSP0171-20130528/12530_1 /TAXON_ID=218684 /ORGANISM="Corethron pennatum, Strain L29A3" /LENGTH=126 /DNA_ID=CAMNT_0039071679 /DNA_START=381 /DNA_END=761 /DNA_ORIENTATION=-